jgi:hypothetical protein
VKRAVVPTTPAGLTGVIRPYVERGLQVAVEAGNQTGWIVDLLRELGTKVHVVHPLKVKLIAESKRKTDRCLPTYHAPIDEAPFIGGTMGAKQDLLQRAEEEYEGLRAAIKGLDDAEMRQVWLGTWGVREIVAHITGWHREIIPALERLRRGEASHADGAYDDFDTWNARFVDARQGLTPAALVDDLDRSHRDLVRAASSLPDEDFAEGGATSGLVDGVAGGHYQEHAEQIRRWRQR